MSIKIKGSEKDNALELKRMIFTLGKELGFLSDTEVKEYSKNLSFNNEYEPEIDAVWYIDISQTIAINELKQIKNHFNLHFIKFLPLVGFEIEASDPTSKTQISNAANLCVQHYPYGFLVVDEEKGEKDLYRRAARILRTFLFQFGQNNYLPLSKSQLNSLQNHQWKEDLKKSIILGKTKYSKGIGGESKNVKKIREKIISIGEKVGFTIRTDWSPDDLKLDFKLRNNIFKNIENPLKEQKRLLCQEISWTPTEYKSIRKWFYFYIRPRIDIIWCIGLPLRFIEFINEIKKLDDDFLYNLPIFRDPKEPYPIIGFEIESSLDKHGGAGILNLSRYTHYGFLVTEKKNLQLLEKKIKTYSRSLGINNVYPLTFEELI